MGIKDLWSVLQPAASTQALAKLAMNSFEANPYGQRGYRVGIDASIWFGHMQVFDGPQFGENPGLRTLFFRCARLAAIPLLPVFVFDGPQRPRFKRGKTIRRADWSFTTDARKIISAFGFAVHDAPGEAEAELAYLNLLGLIDAVWTDDSDAFLFGALTIIRNPSKNLSSNVSSPVVNRNGQEDDTHVRVYNAEDLRGNEKIQLNRSALIFVALLRGGDYDTVGVDGVGMSIAHALARCGFGDRLAHAAQSMEDKSLATFLTSWRSEIVQELLSNSSGHLGKRHPKLAANIPHDFPNLDVYRAYASPVVSGLGKAAIAIDWYRRLDISGLAGACEEYFEWGSRTQILKRFRTLIWPAAVCRTLRHLILEDDLPGRSVAMLPPGPLMIGGLFVKIHDERVHASTDMLRELRLEISPGALASMAEQGISGLRTPLRNGKAPVDPASPIRVWMPATLVRAALPQLVQTYERARASKPERKGKRSAAQAHNSSDSDSDITSRKSARIGQHNPAPSARTAMSSHHALGNVIAITSSDDEDAPPHDTPPLARDASSPSTLGMPATRSVTRSRTPIIISSSEDEDVSPTARCEQRASNTVSVIDLT